LRYEGIMSVMLDLIATGPVEAWGEVSAEFKHRTDIPRDALDRVYLDIGARCAARASSVDGPTESDRYHAAKMRDAIIDARDRCGVVQPVDLLIAHGILWRLLSILLRLSLST
jgi:hypothetical protein